MITTSYSKDKILSLTTPENIYLKFLGLSKITLNKNISSPFSKDENPSFNFYNQENVLKFKCNS